VTVIEYASITCPHCKAFHDQVFPEFRVQYIDTGKVRFVFRELPTAPSALAMAGFLLARCAPEERYFDVLDLLFEKQVPLVQSFQARTAREELLKIARPMGISEEQFDACLENDAEIARIQALGEEGYARFGVTGTPSFVIDGQTYGAMTLEELSAIIDPLLPAEG
jgi:protein-disulfide isomerase